MAPAESLNNFGYGWACSTKPNQKHSLIFL